MAGELFVRVNGSYKRVPHDDDGHIDGHGFFVRVNGGWKRVQEGFVRVNGSWESFYGPGAVEPPPDPPAPGEHILGASAIWLPTDQQIGYAEFNTTDFQGYITQIHSRMSWNSIGSATGTFSITGRPNGNFYRNIDNPGQWSTRTIDHRIDSFDATSLTDFNNGSAIGFTFGYSGTTHKMGILLSNAQLKLTV